MTTLSEKNYTDQLGRQVYIPILPHRIISLVPSQTELLFDLGAAADMAGITKYCIYPADAVKNITKIGGTKHLDIALIKNLRPDLIIANKEENEQSQIEELMRHYPVWVSDINDLESALNMIHSVGSIVGRQHTAQEIARKVKADFNSLTPLKRPLTAAYFIWRKPYMLAGRHTFINNMLARCGLTNITDQGRYPEIDMAQLSDLKPEVIFLSSEPYPFRQKHIAELKAILPLAKIYLVNGELFSWYGSRLKHSAEYFKLLISKIEHNIA